MPGLFMISSAFSEYPAPSAGGVFPDSVGRLPPATHRVLPRGRFVMFTHSLVSTVADNFIFLFIQYRTTDTNTHGDLTG